MNDMTLSNPLRDVASSIGDTAERHRIRCSSALLEYELAFCLASWHALLHSVTAKAVVISTRTELFGSNDIAENKNETGTPGEATKSCLNLSSELTGDSTFNSLLQDIEKQYRCLLLGVNSVSPQENKESFEADDAAGHVIYLIDDDSSDARADLSSVEITLIREPDGWYLDYASALYSPEYIANIAALWLRIARQVGEEPEMLISSISMLDQDIEFRAEMEGPTQPVSGNLVSRFCGVARSFPNKIAVKDGSQTLTYECVDKLSNYYSAILLDAGIEKGDCVGVSFNRNVKMIVAQIAVLKAGGVFVPMDAEQPSERLQAITEDASIRLVLTGKDCVSLLNQSLSDIKLIEINSIDYIGTESSGHNKDFSDLLDQNDIAYVIFTSGSTGRPKGVRVSHGNLLNFIEHIDAHIQSIDVATQFAPFTFDASVAEIHVTLLHGGTLVLLPKSLIDDPLALQAYMCEERVSFAAFPPQYAKHLSPENLPCLKVLLTAGSAPDRELIARWQPHVRYLNAYGPTETTILSTAWEADRVPGVNEPIAMGLPILNTSVRVVNRFGQVLPEGIVGELVIGGAGVAHGYLKQAQLSARNFLEFDNKRWYKSGDLSCLNAKDGLIFVGRIDDQIKLRGHRLELGEIETAILTLPFVDGVAAVAHKVEGDYRLTIFCQGRQQEETAMRESLRTVIPAWAMPNRIHWLDSLPTTTNGKTDYKLLKRQLRQFEESQLPQGIDCANSADSLDASVAAVWQKVLKSQNLDVDANFIHLGGDSLTAMVVASSLRQLGFNINSAHVLSRPVLSDFCRWLSTQPRIRNANFEPWEGAAVIHPMQAWFFNLNLSQPNLFCQSLVFDCDGTIDAARLTRALERLTHHHDMLRAYFPGWGSIKELTQLRQVIDAPHTFVVSVEEKDVVADRLAETSELTRQSLAAELDIATAPLFRLSILRTPEMTRVVWVLHHLLTDTISHSILLEDLNLLYEADAPPEQVLTGKSGAYAEWAERLQHHIDTNAEQLLNSWLPAIEASTHAQELVGLKSANKNIGLNEHYVCFDHSTTQKLLRVAPNCYRHTPEDLVLAAAYLALAKTFNLNQLGIDIEWYGRDEKFAGDFSLTHSVGWFTSVHPLFLSLESGFTLEDFLILIKEARAQVPSRGRDFYGLRYLCSAPNVVDAFRQYRQPEVLFNFSGVTDRQQNAWSMAPVTAIEMGTRDKNPYNLSIESAIQGGELKVGLFVSEAIWPEELLLQFKHVLSESLVAVIEHCCAPENRRWTPSDFPLLCTGENALSQEDIDAIPLDAEAAFPLTDMQRTMLRHEQTYQVWMHYAFDKLFSETAFSEAIDQWVSLHPCLRTAIKTWQGGQAAQIILRQHSPVLDVEYCAVQERQQRAESVIQLGRKTAVEVEKQPPYSVTVLHDAEPGFSVILSIHHMIHDGWSVELLLGSLYRCYCRQLGESFALEETVSANLEELVREQIALSSDSTSNGYWSSIVWREQFCRLPELKPEIQTNISTAQEDVALYLDCLPPEVIGKLRDAAQHRGVTLNTLLLTAYVLLLRYLGGASQVRCGVIQSGRSETIADVARLTGCCVNTLPLVMDFSRVDSLQNILEQVSENLSVLRSNAAFPLSKVVEYARKQVDGDIFSSLFNIESDAYGSDKDSCGYRLVGGYESTNYPFIFGVIETANSERAGGFDYGLRIGYNTAKYNLVMVRQWVEIYTNILMQLAGDLNLRWEQIQPLPQIEKAKVAGWNHRFSDYPRDVCIGEHFKAAAHRDPNKAALCMNDKVLSYAALDQATDTLARLLVHNGVGPEIIVGLVAERSMEMVLGILAILKAGGAYVPIDPEYPAGRVAHILAETEANVVLLQQAQMAKVLPIDHNLETIVLDQWQNLDASSLPSINVLNHHTGQLAYVLYTSGSTGQPKGVMVEQRAIVRLVKNATDLVFSGDDILMITSAPGFDVTTFEIWSALLNGLTLVVVDKDTLLNPEKLAVQLHQHNVSFLWLVAPLYNQLIQEKPDLFSGVKRLMIGGDALSPYHIKIALETTPDLQIINGYGPTENTAFSTYHFLTGEEGDFIPIGRPINQSTAYIANGDGQLLPPGVRGELLVGGDGVARGYFKKQELTASQFVANTFDSHPGRLYRTGDLASWRDDGLIDFYGRIDFQIKIRGFRVELGEIETVLLAEPGVAQALVLLQEYTQNDSTLKRLVAFAVLTRQGSNSSSQLRQALQARLPDYMVPELITVVEEMPLNANGKIDRAALLALADVPQSTVYDLPVTEGEKLLYSVWQDVLGHSNFGVTNSFYSVGGDSILAIQIVARAAKAGLQLTTRIVMQQRTIRDTVKHVRPEEFASIERNFALVTLNASELADAHAQLGEIADVYPATAMQESLILYSQRSTEPGAYLTQVTVSMANASADLMRRSWEILAQRHDILRTAFYDLNQSSLMQVVATSVSLPWQEITESDATALAILEQEKQASFDAQKAPLWRLVYVHRDEGKADLIWTHHHALLDGWSISLLLKDLLDIYRSLAKAERGFDNCVEQEASTQQFNRYIGWLAEQDEIVALDHWRQRLSDVEGASRLSRRDNTGLTNGQALLTRYLSAEQTTALRNFAIQSEITLSALLRTAWAMLLSRYTGETRVMFGCAVSGRPPLLDGVESTAGLFINSLPCVVSLAAEQPIVDLLQRVMDEQLLDEEYGFLPLPTIQKSVGGQADDTLFESLLVVENFPLNSTAFESSDEFTPTITDVHGTGTNNIPLNIVVYPGAQLKIDLAYQNSLFSAEEAGDTLGYLLNLLTQFAEHPRSRVRDFSLMDESTKQKILADWNETRLDVPDTATVYERFASTLHHTNELTPAVICGEQRLSRRELNERVCKVATQLQRLGVKTGDCVAVTFEKDPAFIIVVLSLAKIGAAYVPIATDCPQARRDFICADANIRVTLTQAHLLEQFVNEAHKDTDHRYISIEQIFETTERNEFDSNAADTRISSDSSLYVIYTSGTTGEPKGVKVSHQNIINFCVWCREANLVTEGLAITQFAPFTFDASAAEIFSALLNGAELHLLDDGLVHDYRKLIAYLHQHNIGFSAFPPPYLEQMPIESLPAGMTVLTAGSAPSLPLVKKLASQVRYINGYGPTETTVLSTAWEYNQQQVDEGSLPIGKPITNTQVYILDHYDQLCPVGIVGEICIAGAGVCLGYLNRDDLNTFSFVEDVADSTKKMYRTGDLGRWLPNGDIAFVGRRDSQIKIRGYRIELSEIESQLLNISGIGGAAVAVFGDEGSEKQLFAWVVPEQANASDERNVLLTTVKRHLQENLPPYMIPQAIQIIASLPLTANGKVDIKALPKPDAILARKLNYEPPKTRWETRLVDLWADTLKLDGANIGIYDNFFELGGHSLLATRLCSALIEKYQIEIPIAAVFEYGSLSALADFIQNTVDSDSCSAGAQDTSTSAVTNQSACKVSIPQVARTLSHLPLSDAQRRLWFLTELGGATEAYNMAGSIGIHGDLNIDALRQSLNYVVERHEVLRSNIRLANGQPVQIVKATALYPLSVIDLTNVDNQDAEIQKHLQQEQTTPFNLIEDSLIRGQLLILAKNRFVLINTVHHIVADGWSMGVLLREMSEAYAANLAGSSPTLTPLPIQYADYAHWQQQAEQQAKQSTHLDFWKTQLEQLPALHSVPLDFVRPAQQDHTGSHYFAELSPALSAQLRSAAREHQVSVFMVLYACFSGLLSRYSNETDIVVGTPTANREQPELAGLIGFFANTLVLRANLADNPSFKVILDRAKAIVTNAYFHQSLPFERLVDELHPEREQSYHPLFQIMISMISSDELNSFSMAGVELQRMDNSARTTSKFDLTLTISEEGENYGLLWNYATALFSADRVRAMHGHFHAFLTSVLAEPNLPLSDVNILSDDERLQLLEGWNQTAKPFPTDTCIHELIAYQASITPDNIAARYLDESINYAQLNRSANQLARHLIALGIGEGDRVGMLCQRGIASLIGLFGALKAGAAFVPMDTRAPTQRLAYLIEDAGTAVVITQESLAANLAATGAKILVLDGAEARQTLASYDASNLESTNPIQPRTSAYVIYTSGSTGQPKGVCVDHRAVVNYITHMHDKCGKTIAGAVVSNPLSFDGIGTTLWQILKGVMLELLPEGEGELEALAHHLTQSDRPLLFKVTPSHLTSLKSLVSDSAIKGQPHCIVSGGEGFPVALAYFWQQKLPQAQLVNHYGPTEATVGCCHYFVPTLTDEDLKRSELLPIGRPMSNRQLTILDSNQHPVPFGVIGELHIGGEGLATGYLNRESQTRAAFIVNPFVNPDAVEKRMYRTGDLGRYLSDGNIEYIGRIDHQVKIRGFRIECGEIENCILNYPGLEKCAVLVDKRDGNSPVLLAFVVPQNKRINAGERDSLSVQISDFVAKKLPDYMVPSAIAIMDFLPLTSNGKLDRKSLLNVPIVKPEVLADATPLTATERKLMPFWQKVLKRDDVAINDEFFQVGGHSLMAAELIGLIRQKLKWNVPLRVLFDKPTLKAFAEYCQELDIVKFDLPMWLEDHKIDFREYVYKDEETLIDDGRGNLEQLEKTPEKHVLVMSEQAKTCMADLKAIINNGRGPDMPQYFVFSQQPDEMLKALEQHGLSAIASDSVSSELTIESMAQSLGNSYLSQLFVGEPVDHFPATPMQKTMLNWKQRQFQHAILVNGYFSDIELEQAFLQVQCEQELLTARYNGDQSCWDVYSPPGRPLATVVDLRFLPISVATKFQETLAKSLIQHINEETLPYIAYWVRLSDSRQVLYFINDHLIADKTAIDVLGNRVEMYLTGKRQAISRAYRDYAESIQEKLNNTSAQAIEAEIDGLFSLDTLLSVVAKTRDAIEKNKNTEMHVLDMRFTTIENTPIEHAFSVFRRIAFELLKTNEFCMTLNYHSRQQQGNKDYDQVGLYLDRVPYCVNAGSSASEMNAVLDFVADTGISFTGIEERKLLGEKHVIPEFGADILFNFLGEDRFEKIAAGVESKNISNLQDFHGILLEAYTVENALYTRLVFHAGDTDYAAIKSIYEENIVEFSRSEAPTH